MTLELLATALIFLAIGHASGKNTKQKQHKYTCELISAYKDIFEEFYAADRALMGVLFEEEQIDENLIQKAWESLDSMNRTFLKNKFLLSQDVVQQMEELFSANIGTSWNQRLKNLRTANEKIQDLARIDIEK